MTTLPQMGLVLPTRGVGGAGVWDDSLDADLTAIDAHDHSTGRGTPVPTAGININADLTFSSLYAPINLHRLTFASIVALTSNNKSLFVSSADNELYWRSNAGTNVKITSGASLNVAAFTGGIGGDYTAVSAAVAFDDAGDRYTFKQNAGTGWARLASGDLRLFETGTSDSVFVGLAAPAALAGSYTITLPLTAPTTGTRPVQMTTAGVITAGNSDNVQVGGTLGVTGAATLSSTLGVTGATTLSSTLDVGGILSSAGLIFGQNGLTAAVNTHVTVSGTGELKHGTRTLQVPIRYDGTNVWNDGITVDATVIGISLRNGDRIVAVRARIQDSVTGPTKMTIVLQSVVEGVASTVATSAQSSGAGTKQTIAITGLTSTIASGTNYQLKFLRSTGAANVATYWIEVDYDRP